MKKETMLQFTVPRKVFEALEHFQGCTRHCPSYLFVPESIALANEFCKQSTRDRAPATQFVLLESPNPVIVIEYDSEYFQ